MTKISTTKILITSVTTLLTSFVIVLGILNLFSIIGLPTLGTFLGFIFGLFIPGRIFNWILKEELEEAKAEQSEE